jgi:hypothetical protein
VPVDVRLDTASRELARRGARNRSHLALPELPARGRYEPAQHLDGYLRRLVAISRGRWISQVQSRAGTRAWGRWATQLRFGAMQFSYRAEDHRMLVSGPARWAPGDPALDAHQVEARIEMTTDDLADELVDHDADAVRWAAAVAGCEGRRLAGIDAQTPLVLRAWPDLPVLGCIEGDVAVVSRLANGPASLDELEQLALPPGALAGIIAGLGAIDALAIPDDLRAAWTGRPRLALRGFRHEPAIDRPGRR